MFGTLFTTTPADLSAKAADFGREIRSTGHERGGQSANLRAIHVEFDASGHHPDIRFGEA
jgi:hypothetical protein